MLVAAAEALTRKELVQVAQVVEGLVLIVQVIALQLQVLRTLAAAVVALLIHQAMQVQQKLAGLV